jgi:hypothetical protein
MSEIIQTLFLVYCGWIKTFDSKHRVLMTCRQVMAAVRTKIAPLLPARCARAENLTLSDPRTERY